MHIGSAAWQACRSPFGNGSIYGNNVKVVIGMWAEGIVVLNKF
jgi:hypothetical protein